MQAVYTKIITWLVTMVPQGCTVIIADQNAPTPARPFVTVKIGTVTDIARDFSENVRDTGDNGTGPFPRPAPAVPVFARDVVRFVRMTVNLQVHGQPAGIHSAEAIAQGILDHAYNSDAALDTLGRSLVFQMVLTPPQSAGSVIGSEMEPRVVMALQFGATRDLVYQIGGISTVIITGSAGAQNIESEAKWPSP